MKIPVVALLGLFAATQAPSPATSATCKTESQLLDETLTYLEGRFQEIK